MVYSGVSAQQNNSLEQSATPETAHTFYVVSNLGEAAYLEAEELLSDINRRSRNDDAATLLILGNTVPSTGFSIDKKEQIKIKKALNRLMQLWDGFNGKVIITPGHNEWARDAPQSIDALESYLQDHSKAKFWPNDGCPLERETINDHVVLELVDSRWFLEDWDQHPYINGTCEHKSRADFLAEFKDDIKDSQGKTVVVALFEPIISNTRVSAIEKMGGFSTSSQYNSTNRSFRGQLKTVASQFDDVVFVSGKDFNLQYLEDNGVPQIISGAIGKIEKAKAQEQNQFAAVGPGYAKLSVYKGGGVAGYFLQFKRYRR